MNKYSIQVFVALFLFFGGLGFAEEEGAKEHGNRAAPCFPEALASLIDPFLKKEGGEVTLALVPHRNPSAVPPEMRATWVALIDGTPIWVVTSPPKAPKGESTGETAAALKRARLFIAEAREGNGVEERLAGWKPRKETLLPAYQREKYGLQITKIKLVDRKTGSWEIKAEPVQESMGGEMWMRFRKDTKVSAELGR